MKKQNRIIQNKIKHSKPNIIQIGITIKQNVKHKQTIKPFTVVQHKI